MGLSPEDRKSALERIAVTQGDIARALNPDPANLGSYRTLVCHVMKGRRWNGAEAKRIQQHIAERLGQPVAEVFPESLQVKRIVPPNAKKVA